MDLCDFLPSKRLNAVNRIVGSNGQLGDGTGDARPIVTESSCAMDASTVRSDMAEVDNRQAV
jgi:hypothetical protein